MDSDDKARELHISRVILGSGLGPDAVVNGFGTSFAIHLKGHEASGHWLATIPVEAAAPPVEIGNPRFVFVPDGGDRYGNQPRKEAVPIRLVARAELARDRLVAMRDDGLFMTPAEVREMVGTFRDLLRCMREEGIQDEAGHASRAAALLWSHNPALPWDMETENPGPR